MFVYVAQLKNTNLYKIGHTNNPKRRLRELQTGNSTDILLHTLFICDNVREVEKLIHDKLLRYRKRSEWFELPDRELNNLLFELKIKHGLETTNNKV